MLFTDKRIYIEKMLFLKLQWMAHRCTKKKHFNLIIVDGFMGYGKTNASACMGYVLSKLTGRVYDNSRIFFNPDDMFNFAKSNKDMIIHWDESATAGLASEWQRKIQKKIRKLILMGRKKRHCYILCIPKFYELTPSLIDAATGMIHMYSPDEDRLGYFYYYNKTSLTNLYQYYRKKKVMNHGDWKKYKTFRGTFSYRFPEIINEDAYEKDKDYAIEHIDDEAEKESKQPMLKLQFNIAKLVNHLMNKGITKQECAFYLGVETDTLRNWAKIGLKHPEVLGNEAKTSADEPKHNSKWVEPNEQKESLGSSIKRGLEALKEGLDIIP